MNIARLEGIIEQNKMNIARLEGIIEQNKIKQQAPSQTAPRVEHLLARR